MPIYIITGTRVNQDQSTQCDSLCTEQNITYKGFEGHFYRINGWHTMQYYVIHVIHPTDAIFAPGALQDLRNVMMNCIDASMILVQLLWHHGWVKIGFFHLHN